MPSFYDILVGESDLYRTCHITVTHGGSLYGMVRTLQRSENACLDKVLIMTLHRLAAINFF